MEWSPKTKINPETGKPVTWQKPKSEHPWRQYKDRIKPDADREDIVPLKEYLESLIENWDEVEVTSFGDMGSRTYTLKRHLGIWEIGPIHLGLPLKRKRRRI